MCECDATIRDLRWSLERAHETISRQVGEIGDLFATIQNQQASIEKMSGMIKTFSLSMGVGANKEIIDETRWHLVSLFLARKLALRDSENDASVSHLIDQWIGLALSQTQPIHTDPVD